MPEPSLSPPIISTSCLVDDLDDLLAGVELADHLGPERALADAVGEFLDDLEVDVGLEQREADLAHRARHVLLAQHSPRAKAR